MAPELGNAYLGTQGDPWNAQQDMALATRSWRRYSSNVCAIPTALAQPIVAAD